MEASYHAVSGQESIYFMFQKPALSYVEAVHTLLPEGNTFDCGKAFADHSPADVMRCFCAADYRAKAYVPNMFIPCCGQVGLNCCKNLKFNSVKEACTSFMVIRVGTILLKPLSYLFNNVVSNSYYYD